MSAELLPFHLQSLIDSLILAQDDDVKIIK